MLLFVSSLPVIGPPTKVSGAVADLRQRIIHVVDLVSEQLLAASHVSEQLSTDLVSVEARLTS